MRFKMLTATAVIFLMLTAGCSTLERVVYRQDINQGNYLVDNDIAKINTGMTQQQVAYILGTPMIYDQFGSNIWYYVSRQKQGHGLVKQHTLTLIFDQNGKLTNINNEPILEKIRASYCKLGSKLQA